MMKSRSSSDSDSGGGGDRGSGSGKSCYRGHWRPVEDQKLRQLVEQFGPQNWNFIAEHFQGRSGKSCRLRWYNQLDPNINKNPFSEEEEERLLIYQQLHGNKWALIARHFKGRTDNAVKNHYHVIMARRRRERFTIFTNKSINKRNYTSQTQPQPQPQAPYNDNFGFLKTSCFQKHENKWSWFFGASSSSKAEKEQNINETPFPCEKEEERKNGPINDQQKVNLPFIDFLGMGST